MAYKGISDYGVGRDAVITMAQAQEALENAARFIKWVEAQLEKSG